MVEERPTITVLTPQPFTEATLDGIILLTLNNGTYVRSRSDIKNAITVSGIVGITVGRYVRRESDTQISVELDFNGNIDTDAALTFTVGAGAIARYDGPALIVQVSVTGGTESVAASTPTALTESMLHGSVVTLTLNGATYERSTFDLRDAVEISGIDGVTYHWFDLDRVSDTALTVELKFNGNIDTDATLTFTVGADAMAGYNGPALITTLPVTAGQESVVASIEAPLTESTLDESVVTLTLSGGVYESEYTVGKNVTVSGIDGVTIGRYDVDRVSDTVITVELDFEGNFDTDVILTLAVKAGALVGYNGPALIAKLPVTGSKESIVASTEAPLTESTLHESVVTLTLSGGLYRSSSYYIRDHVTVSGIDGVTIGRYDVDRINSTKITVELTFNGNIDTDAPLTFSVGAGALVGYNGPALIATLPVTAGQESVVASIEAPLTESTLDESVVTLTLSGGVYESEYTVGKNVTVSGIDGVTIGRYDVDRVSDTVITVELDFEGNFDTDVILTLAVKAGALVGYNGPALIAKLPVTGSKESIVASTEAPLTESTLHESVVTLTLSGGLYRSSSYYIRDHVTVSGIDGVTIGRYDVDRINSTKITVELTFNGNIDTDAPLTFSVGAGALVGYNGPALIATLPVTAGQESVVASIEAPLTESTLDESVVTLTLSGGVYESEYTVGKNVTVSGIDGVTIGRYDVDRISDTVITVELDFEGNFDTDVILTLAVKAGALVGYNGPALIAKLPVTGSKESIVASTEAPLTESTLHESVVTLTLSGGLYRSSSYYIKDHVMVSGIEGVTVGTYDVDRINSTKITVELTFNGNIDTDAPLTFSVGAGALIGYNGPALIATLPVTAGQESVVASIEAPLTESTLDESVVTLTLSGGVYESEYTVGKNVTVSGIDGVTIGRYDVDRVSDTVITVELDFEGNFDTDVTLTLVVKAGALVGYNGPALIATLPVTGSKESIVASTEAPLTESTLHESVVTLTLSGGLYRSSSYYIRDHVTVSGIDGVTIGRYDVDRINSTKITVELTFNGNIDTDAPLTFSVGAGALIGYNGPALIATLPVTGSKESVVASTDAPLTESTLDESVVTLTLSGGFYRSSSYYIRGHVTVSGIDGVTIGRYDVDRINSTKITVELTFNGNIDTDALLTFTVGADAIARYSGPALTTQVLVTTGGAPVVSVAASPAAPLTEATLDGSVVRLTLTGATYKQSIVAIKDAVTVSGIPGVTVATSGVRRVNNAEITVQLEFAGNFDADTALIFTVGAGALADYNGSTLATQVPVTGVKELVVASTDAPLTETTLNGSVVRLTLTGATYKQSIVAITDAVTVSGIAGVTVGTSGVRRVNNTEITVALEFNGDFDADTTLIFTVRAGALAGYNGSTLATQVPVTGVKESVVASTDAPLTETTLNGSVVRLTLTGATYKQSIVAITDAVTVSGIAGVTVGTSGVRRVNNTEITVALEFNGDFDADTTLIFTVRAGALAGYNGSTLATQVPVTGVKESVVASTDAPLTEATLNGSVVTLTLTGGSYERALRAIRDAVTVSGISGVTVGTLGINRVNDTVVTVELRFNGNLHVDATLIFTVGADAIANYNGPALTAIRPVTAVVEAVVEENPTIAETSLMAIEGTIKTEDGIPAEAGLQVTVIIGSNTQTGVSEVGGVYTITILNLQGDVIATSGDTVTVQVRNPNTGAAVERTVQLSSQQILDKEAIIDLQFSPTPSATDREYLLSVPAGISLIHVPLKVTAVDGVAKTRKSVGDLYDALGGASAVALLITYDPETGRWNSYLHDGHRGRPGDRALTDDLGIIASMKVAKSVRLSGDALGTNGRSSITLQPGINLVGVPLRDSRITRVSDLLDLEGIAGNVSLIIVSDNGFKVVTQAGDPGDIPVTGGGAFILTARNAATVEITGTKWSNPLGQTAAPSTALTGIQTDGVTPVLAVTGSISPVVGKSVSRPFHVTVKNRSTGTVDTAMTDDDGVSYQFTFVDLETGSAARVGDILEITAYSPDPFVGVQPLRHTVTDEDVKRNWISLGALVAYEIPAKTELLSNYPNPFNPETWIPYRLAKDAFVTLTIYDRSGRVVREIDVGHRIAAVYESRSKAVHWDGRTEFGERVASGIYFYSLTAGDYSATRKMVILK